MHVSEVPTLQADDWTIARLPGKEGTISGYRTNMHNPAIAGIAPGWKTLSRDEGFTPHHQWRSSALRRHIFSAQLRNDRSPSIALPVFARFSGVCRVT